MKLVIFIGHHKVGSTSLQAFLSLNRNRLIESGILYPMIEEPSLAKSYRSLQLQLRAKILGQSRYEAIPVNQREPHNALAFRLVREYKGKSTAIPFHKNIPSSDTMLEIIRTQIDKHNPEGLILCSEVFSTFGDVSGDLVKWVHDSFPAESVTIICTLRRIDQYICSWYGQRLKFGHNLSPLRKRGVNKFMGTTHFNYRKLLKAWQEGFPNANFIVRNYSSVLENGGSVPDFKAHSGLNFPSGLHEYANANTSIPYCFYELCRKANQDFTAARASLITERINHLCKTIDLPANSEIELLGSRNRGRIYKRFDAIHSYLSRLSGEDAFFPDQERVLECNSKSEFEAAAEAFPAILTRLGRSPLDRDICNIISVVEDEHYWS